MNYNQMNLINYKKLQARIIKLSRLDIISGWNRIPAYIIHSFFGDCTYSNRMQVATFCYVNGIDENNMMKMCFWTTWGKNDNYKLRQLLKDLTNKEEFRYKYYSWNVYNECLRYCNGDFKRNGKREVPYSYTWNWQYKR